MGIDTCFWYSSCIWYFGSMYMRPMSHDTDQQKHRRVTFLLHIFSYIPCPYKHYTITIPLCYWQLTQTIIHDPTSDLSLSCQFANNIRYHPWRCFIWIELMFFVFTVLFFHDEIVFCFYGCFFMMKLGLKSKSIIILLFFFSTSHKRAEQFQISGSWFSYLWEE